MGIIHLKDLLAVISMLFELLCLRRWSALTVSNGRFNESAKQALNCTIAYFWAVIVKHQGYDVDFTKIPKLAISRGFAKTVQCDIAETNLEQIFAIRNSGKTSDKIHFTEMVDANVAKMISPSFFKFLAVSASSLEARIYKAATKVATLLEFNDLNGLISLKDYEWKLAELNKEVQRFSDLPGFDQIMSEPYQEIFRSFSKLRNRIRWAKHPNIVQCSVMSHLYDVASLGYLMSIDANPSDENLATHYFFMGVFHDFPETWTGDMPSPIKDGIEGLRKATEEFENRVLEENVYAHLPEYMVKAIRAVMLEDDQNAQLKAFLKMSDIFDAYVECWREIDAGSHHHYYRDVIVRDYKIRKKLPPTFRRCMTSLRNDAFDNNLIKYYLVRMHTNNVM